MGNLSKFIALAALVVALVIIWAEVSQSPGSESRETASVKRATHSQVVPGQVYNYAGETGVPRRRKPDAVWIGPTARREPKAPPHEKKSPEPMRGSPMELLGMTALPTPGPVPLQQGNYAAIPDVFALPENAFRESADFTVVQRGSGYVYFRAAAGRGVPPGALPVAMHTGDGTLGAVTGVVVVKTKSASSASTLSSDYRLTPVQFFEQINTAIYQSGRSNQAELNSLLAALRHDERVNEADLEILSRFAVPQ